MKKLTTLLTVWVLVLAGACNGEDTSDADSATDNGGTGTDMDAGVATDEGGNGVMDTGSTGGTPDAGTTGGTGSATGMDIIIVAPDMGGGMEDAGKAGPANTCREAALCRVDCGPDDTACSQACTEGAAQAIVDAMTAVDTCLANKCEGTDSLQCLTDSQVCFTEFQACFMDGKSGEKTCEEAVECFAQCGMADAEDVFEEFGSTPKNPMCEDACMQDASAEAQQDFLVYAFCVVSFCKAFPDEECQKNSGGTCGSAELECLNVQ